MQDQCTREDLQAIVPRYDRWSVKGDGELDDFWADGTLDAGTADIEEYTCASCGEFFTPKKRDDLGALDLAWTAALAHLPEQEVA